MFLICSRHNFVRPSVRPEHRYHQTYSTDAFWDRDDHSRFKVKRSKLNTSCGAICESTANPVPVLRIAASHGFSELTKNVSWSSHGHSTPLKVSCKSVQPFSRNLANKETNKQRYKEIDRKQYPVPRCIGDGVITAKQCWKQHAL